jgi:O-antigen/teichoic acid export membrane protein
VRSESLVRAGAVTYLFSAIALGANLVSGIVSARALGPSGRGVTVGLSAVVQLLGFFFAMGAAQSLSYFIARRAEDGPRLFTTWILILLPLSLLGIVAGELLLGAIFSAHNSEAITVGRWFMFTVVLVIALEFNSGLLLGAHDFFYFNALRLAQPVMMAASFVVLWAVGALTVSTALIAPTVGTAIVLVVGIGRSLRRVGVGPPDMRLGRETLWYGLRGHGLLIATNLNARLDLAILPAFVAAFSVGLYSVATNVSLIVYQLSNTFAALVLPAAAREPGRARQKVLGSLFATMAIAALMALILGLFAAPVLGLVYGRSFRQAAPTLQLLLPGAVLFAGSSILSAGIYAAGRPFTTTLTQLAGMTVTVVGLVLFLPTGGITAAAIVSTTAYTTVFVSTLVAYKLINDLPWRSFLPTPARLRDLTAPPPDPA